jgi:hypothetical protein
MKVIFLFCVIFILLQQAQGAVKSLNSNATSLCSNGCNWDTPAIWADLIVPVAGDTVDINLGGSYRIIVNADVNIDAFNFGTNDPDDKHRLEVSNGVTMRSVQFVTQLSTTFTVNLNASIISVAKSTFQGPLIVYGTASFAGNTPDLVIDTYSAQKNPLKMIYGKLEIQGGTVFATNIDVSLTSDIVGTGHINATVYVRGNLRPGLGNVGTLYISGNLVMDNNADIYIDLSDVNTYDRVIIGGEFYQEGDLIANLLNNYEPLSRSRFRCFNHTSQSKGFNDVSGEGAFNKIFNKKWKVRVDQSYTELQYDSASSVFLSLSAIVVCLFFTLL